MSTSYRAGSDSPPGYSDEVWQVTRPDHSDPSQRNQQQIPLTWEASQQNAVFYNDGLWWDTARSSSSSDTSSPQLAEQQSMTIWEASSQKAKEYMLDRQLEQDPIISPHHNSSSDFISTSVSREHVSESLTRRRAQNRDAQRAFRARERIRVQALEDQLEDITKQYTKLKSAYVQLNSKYQSILKQAEIKEEDIDGTMPLWEEGSASNFETFSSLYVPEALHDSQ